MDNYQKAERLFQELEAAGIEVGMKVTLRRPSGRIDPALEARAREVADELRQIVAAREMLKIAGAQRPGLPCVHCAGSGLQPSALEQWPQIEYLLHALIWDPARIAVVHDLIRSDEYLMSVRHGGVDLKDLAGNQRTLGRWDS